jgi:glycosyltransferase involved in cell wall biosynthesis
MMFIFQNPDDRTTVLKARAISSQKAEVIRGSGVDVEKYQPTALPKGVPTVLLACRLIKDKGVLEYVEAATRLRKNGVNARFLLAGIPDKGNPSAISEEFLNSLRGENYIEWVGWQEDIRSCISNCRIACLPSYREGLPQFLLQAAAMGRPAVATDVPGCREVVIHKYNGLLVPPKESRGLTDSLQTLIENPALCEEMGNRGALHVRQHFGINTVAEQTLQLYQRLTDL